MPNQNNLKFLKKIEDFCLEYDMLPRFGGVIAAVSGGADSMCLLTALHAMAPKYGFTLTACHFNHGLRGEESDADEAFVAEYCRSLGIDCLTGRGDVRAYSRQNSCGIEEAARILRYAFFADCSQKLLGAPVATAHNADDNAETVLMNLMRGAGSRGLGGIPPVREGYIRPLLCLTRHEIEEVLRQNGVPHREDSTNALDDTLRNRIRHHITPKLKELCPQWSANVASASRLSRLDDECLTAMAADFLKENQRDGRLSARAVCALGEPVAARALRMLSGAALSQEQTRALLFLAAGDDPSARLDLPGVTVRREYDDLVFGPAPQRESFPETALVCCQWTAIPQLGRRFYLECTENASFVYNSFTSYLFKKAQVCGMIKIRPRQSGDSIKLSGRGRKTLKKLFIEEKIPAHLRECIPVIADDNGPLAVIGLGADERARTDGKGAVYRLSWEELDNAAP